MKYTVILEKEADGGFVASVLMLPGCVSQGDTREEALANIREAIEPLRGRLPRRRRRDSCRGTLEYVEVKNGAR